MNLADTINTILRTEEDRILADAAAEARNLRSLADKIDAAVRDRDLSKLAWNLKDINPAASTAAEQIHRVADSVRGAVEYARGK